MKLLSVIASTLLFSSLALAQGGGGQGTLGSMQDRYNQLVENIDGQIGVYLNGQEIRNILTPGEFCEWPLKLTAGQVVVSEADSNAFDPAEQILDSKGTVMIASDDRYPGDQRPLIFWRCRKDGDYKLQVRCFLNKAGGEFNMRYNVYDTVDLEVGKPAERSWDQATAFLFRMPMKAGQIRQIVRERPTGAYTLPDWSIVISPTGLPDINLTQPLDSAIPNCVMASVDGDYYVLADYRDGEKRKIDVSLREIQPTELKDEQGVYTGEGEAGASKLWTLQVKAGQFLEFSEPSLNLHANIVLSPTPDISKFDVSKPDTNPFFPAVRTKKNEGHFFDAYPGRARDPREIILLVHKDATVWVATNASGEHGKPFTLTVRSAAQALASGAEHGGKLRIGDTDYWSFDAQIGDVMSLATAAPDFAEKVVTYDPDMDSIWESTAGPDQNALHWNVTATKKGRYLVALSSLGDGGGGSYSVERKVFPAAKFGVGSPASGETSSNGHITAWRFDAKPSEPLLLHWKSSDWAYQIAVFDEKGREINLPLTPVDNQDRFGIVKVSEPTSLLVVLTPSGKSKYDIELSPLPGLAAK